MKSCKNVETVTYYLVFKAHNVFVRAADGFLKSTFKTDASKLYELVELYCGNSKCNVLVIIGDL